MSPGPAPISADEFIRQHGAGSAATASRNKYGAKKTEYNGVTYDSKGEAWRAESLDYHIMLGEVRDWIRQPKVVLGHEKLTYRPDFLVIPAGPSGQNLADLPWYEDFKGVETEAFKKNKHLWELHGRLPLRIVAGTGKKFSIKEIITPRRMA